MILWINNDQGLITFQDNHLIMFKSENISCGGSNDPNGECEVKLFNGSMLKLRVGENVLINQFDMFKINLVNYLSITFLLIGLLINHYLFNKGYDFKEEFNKIKEFKIK